MGETQCNSDYTLKQERGVQESNMGETQCNSDYTLIQECGVQESNMGETQRPFNQITL